MWSGEKPGNAIPYTDFDRSLPLHLSLHCIQCKWSHGFGDQFIYQPLWRNQFLNLYEEIRLEDRPKWIGLYLSSSYLFSELKVENLAGWQRFTTDFFLPTSPTSSDRIGSYNVLVFTCLLAACCTCVFCCCAVDSSYIHRKNFCIWKNQVRCFH